MPVYSPDLHQMLLDAGLERVADVIEREARPSIRLTAQPVEDESSIPLGASKLGGSPDVAPSFEWPRHDGFPLAFIAQINLADTAPYDVEDLLPPKGMLQLFYDDDYFWNRGFETWQGEMELLNNPANWHVLHVPDTAPTLQRTALPLELHKMSRFKACALRFAADVTLPEIDDRESPPAHIGDYLVVPLTINKRERDAYAALQQEMNGSDAYPNRMLGHADSVYGWLLQKHDILLLQIRSEEDADMLWGDGGYLYYVIDRTALANRDFTAVRCEQQS